MIRRSPVAAHRLLACCCTVRGLLLLLHAATSYCAASHLPPPEKLTQGCSPELLHLRTYRHFHVLCRTQPAIAVAAYEGMLDAMIECREHLRFQPWDCSQINTVLHDPPILRLGTRESAYLWAMSSAGAAWGVATACAQGWLADCACNRRDEGKQNWEWGGCSYGVQFGIVTSRKLLTRSAATRSPIRKLEKHNLKAGRLAVKKTLISSCKCHGVSGSCDQKTCWKKAADLASIAAHITNKMHKAKRLVEEDTRAKNAELVYVEDSPDPCATTRTTNRVCNWRNETSSVGDCSLLCCGHGFKVSHELISYQCDCQFVWCCQLKCNTCLRHRWVSTCT